MSELEGPVGPGSALGVEMEMGDDGIAWLQIRPRRGTTLPVSLELLGQLDAHLAEIEVRASTGSVTLLVIETAPPHPALSGYDLEEIRSFSEKGIVGWSQEAQRILRRLERLEIPSVAAMRSDWFGGAAELALSCSYRVGAEGAETRIAFPQTRRGFMPAWGGSVRLPRLIGLQEALRLVLTGEPITGQEALEAGFVDELLPLSGFDDEVHRFAIARIADRTPARRRKRPVRRRLFDETAPGRRLLGARAAKLYLADASANFAARLALELMIDTASLPLEQAFARESTAAGELIVTTEAQGRLHSERLTQRVARRSPMGRAEFEAAAVLGAGETGSDLAHILVGSGTPVRMKGTRDEARAGVARARARLEWERRQGRISEQQAKRRSARLEAATGYGGFGLHDVVLAAADGTAHQTLSLLVDAEPHLRDDCLLGFHDWTASPTALQTELQRPDRLVGLVPALPVDRFPLIEILPGSLTSPDTIAAARRLARRLALTAVVVADPAPSPGTRLTGIYYAEAIRLLEQGATIEQVDDAAAGFGLELGPFHRIDAVGSRRVLRMLTALSDSVGDRMAPGPTLKKIADAGGTFYRYKGGRPAGPSPELPSGETEESDTLALVIRRRLLLLLINEAVKILEEGCVTDPGDLEVISIFGLGFPREHGGILFYAQEIGIDALVADLGLEASRLGDRYAPAGLLRDLASTGRGFFGNDPRDGSGHESLPVLQ